MNSGKLFLCNVCHTILLFIIAEHRAQTLGILELDHAYLSNYQIYLFKDKKSVSVCYNVSILLEWFWKNFFSAVLYSVNNSIPFSVRKICIIIFGLH